LGLCQHGAALRAASAHRAFTFGEALFALRLFPALAGAGTVALTGAIAHQLGGRKWAVTLACVGSLSALVFLAVGNFYSLNAFEPLFWMGCAYLLVCIINGGSIAFG
jgi:dolichyl-phosphate-mannose--protein O-mannosyl transferase